MNGGLAPRWRVPLLAAGFASLVAGVLGGLARIGWTVPAGAAEVAVWHGPLMLGGFFGTVIGLERAVALARPVFFLAPLCSGAAGLALLSGMGEAIAPWLLVAAAVTLVAASLCVLVRQPGDFNVTLALGAAAWLAGNGIWAAGGPLAGALPWWLAFLVLTIAGERLELSRLLPRPMRVRWAFAVIVAGLLLALVALTAGLPALPGLAAALLLLAVWLSRYDIARRTVRQAGLTRYIAVCLLAGYAWLGVAAAVALLTPMRPGTPGYDAALHALLLGFVFSMVFGHAPLIFPAVVRVAMPYHTSFYLPLLLLHGSLLLRLAGDGLDSLTMRRGGALLNAVSLGVFILTMAAAAVRGRHQAPPA